MSKNSPFLAEKEPENSFSLVLFWHYQAFQLAGIGVPALRRYSHEQLRLPLLEGDAVRRSEPLPRRVYPHDVIDDLIPLPVVLLGLAAAAPRLQHSGHATVQAAAEASQAGRWKGQSEIKNTDR